MPATPDAAASRAKLYSLLGDLPPRDRPVAAHLVSEEPWRGGVLEKLVLDLNGVEAVPAYLVRPERGGPHPVVLYNHAHGGNYALGKDELIRDRNGIQSPPYGEALLRLGIASLCIDACAFGERAGRSESEIFKDMLWHGRVMWGMMVFDSLKAIDYLVSRPDIDPRRIATLGLSMGSTMAWWTAALDGRIAACIDLCCLTDYQALRETRGLDGHGIYYYVPSLLKHFDAASINALIAPRPHLSLAGEHDRLTPPAGLDRIDARLKEAYAAAGAPEAWRLSRYQTGHGETAAMRAEALGWIIQKLNNQQLLA